MSNGNTPQPPLSRTRKAWAWLCRAVAGLVAAVWSGVLMIWAGICHTYTFLKDWQTLIGSLLAIAAAVYATQPVIEQLALLRKQTAANSAAIAEARANNIESHGEKIWNDRAKLLEMKNFIQTSDSGVPLPPRLIDADALVAQIDTMLKNMSEARRKYIVSTVLQERRAVIVDCLNKTRYSLRMYRQGDDVAAWLIDPEGYAVKVVLLHTDVNSSIDNAVNEYFEYWQMIRKHSDMLWARSDHLMAVAIEE